MKKQINKLLLFLPLIPLLLGFTIAATQSITYAATVCFPYQGCTGTSTVPQVGQVAVGNGTGIAYLVTSTDGFVLTQSSTAPLGIVWLAAAGASGAASTTIYLTGNSTATGPGFTFATGTAGTNFNITISGTTFTFNCPSASATNRGCLLSGDWSTFNNKLSAAVTSINGSTNAAQTFTTTTATGLWAISTANGVTTATLPSNVSFFTNDAGYSTAVGANPTAKVGLSATNGSSANFMRADGAPALDTSTNPIWTGNHQWTANANPVIWLSGVPLAQTTSSLFLLGTNRISGGSATGTYIGINTSSFAGDFMNLQINSSSIFDFNNAGFLGINQAAPLYPLHVVKSTTGVQNFIYLNNTHAAANDGLSLVFDSSGGGSTATGHIDYVRTNTPGLGGGQMRFYTSSAGSNGVQQMVITGQGYVGIGTTTPQTMLDVNGSSTIRSNLSLTNVTSCNTSSTALQTDSNGVVNCNGINVGTISQVNSSGTIGVVGGSGPTVTIGAKFYPIQWTIDNPTASENVDILNFRATSTISSCNAVNKTTGDTVTIGLGYSTSRATATSSLTQIFSGTTTTITATTTPTAITLNGVGSTTPGLLNPLIFYTTAASSTELTLSCYYSEN